MRKSYVLDYWIGEMKLNRLQDVSSKTEETSKAGTGEGKGLVGTGSSDGGWGGSWDNWGDGGTDGTLGWDSWGSWCSDVGVHWGAGWGNYGGGGHWLDDCAWAVGDGQGGGGSCGVGDAVEGQLSGSWADGGVGSVHLGGVGNGAVDIGGGGCCESENGDGGVLHLDGWLELSYFKKVIS